MGVRCESSCNAWFEEGVEMHKHAQPCTGRCPRPTCSAFVCPKSQRLHSVLFRILNLLIQMCKQ